MKEKRWFAIVYMFGITAFFSSIVISFAQYTKKDIEANKQLAFETAVLNVLPITQDSNKPIHERFQEIVKQPADDSAGAYVVRENGEIIGYALLFSGRGFWAPIKGVIGIQTDKRTITGLAFYEQNETPGLGAEITQKPFLEQFFRKKISLTDKPINIKYPGSQLGPSDVHAVTGATQTCTRVEKMINEALQKWLVEIGQKESE